jgi:hypothetical protein
VVWCSSGMNRFTRHFLTMHAIRVGAGDRRIVVLVAGLPALDVASLHIGVCFGNQILARDRGDCLPAGSAQSLVEFSTADRGTRGLRKGRWRLTSGGRLWATSSRSHNAIVKSLLGNLGSCRRSGEGISNRLPE